MYWVAWEGPKTAYSIVNSRYCRSRHDGRVDGILSICGPEVSRGSLLVVSRRAQAPTPHTRRLPSVHTYKQGPLRSIALDHDPPKFSIQSSRGAPRTGACGLGDHPTSDLSQRESENRSASEKSKQFGPDGAPFPSKTSINRWPPVVAAAVSLDPILPQR